MYGEYTTGIIPSVFDKDDAYSKIQGTRDGAIFGMDWALARSFEGRVYCANGGTVTTPITFGAGSIDSTEPDFFISVPDGTTIVPLEIRVKMEAYGTTAIFELMAAVGTGGSAGTDTDLVAGTTICNLRSDAPNASLCSIGVASNAGATYMTTNISEFWREGCTKVATVSTGDDDSSRLGETWVWNAKEKGFAPVLIGASQLMVFAASEAGTGFITVIYAEFPSTRVS